MKINVIAKCNDMCSVSVDELNLKKNGYVPRNLGIGGGDYIRLTIDASTGKIDGWLPISPDDLEEALN